MTDVRTQRRKRLCRAFVYGMRRDEEWLGGCGVGRPGRGEIGGWGRGCCGAFLCRGSRILREGSREGRIRVLVILRLEDRRGTKGEDRKHGQFTHLRAHMTWKGRGHIPILSCENARSSILRIEGGHRRKTCFTAVFLNSAISYFDEILSTLAMVSYGILYRAQN